MDEARHKHMDKGGSIVFSEFLWKRFWKHLKHEISMRHHLSSAIIYCKPTELN
jgi:hypothetical protein